MWLTCSPEVAAIYPITPSSTMAELRSHHAVGRELVDEWAGAGNIFGETVKVVGCSRRRAPRAPMHSSLQSGALTSTFTVAGSAADDPQYVPV